MVGHDGSVKVVDFGIARTILSTVHTSPGVVRGKASYMSPEQCLGDPVDHRTDVFALGVVLYELTTGARCFNGKNDFERMLSVVRGEFLAPSSIDPSFPSLLEAVIRKCLAENPDQRYQSCAALAEALDEVMRTYSWIGGTTAIVRIMRELFGEPGDELVVLDTTEPALSPIPTVCDLPKIPRRMARGTHADLFDDHPFDDDSNSDDDCLTRGRRSLPRMPAMFAA
jgi:serine/threonine-protein kinase